MKKKILTLLFIILCTVILSACNSECKHLYMSEETIPPTCDEEGRTVKKCLDCSFSYYSDFTVPTGHSFTAQKVAPSCGEEGYTLYTCHCSYSYKSEFTPPEAHTLVPTVISPTCTERGYTVYFCNCGYSYRGDYTSPLNHDYEITNRVWADCVNAGHTEYTCRICSQTYNGSYVSPKGHSFSSQTFYPTCISGGHTLHTCSVCDYSYSSDYLFYSDIIESAFTNNTQILSNGLDVSKWNHQKAADGSYLPLDWKKIKDAGFDFVILKAGSTVRSGGLGGIEPTFEMDYKGAKEAGLNVGVYFYTYAHSVEEIELDALALLEYIRGKKFEFPIYLDMEESSQQSLGKDLLGKMCTKFISTLQSKGYYAGVYLNNNWLYEIFDRVEMTTLFDLWYARYVGTDSPTWNEELYGKQLGMWQYTQTGVIDGIAGNFDFNYAYRDYPELMKKWHLNGY